MLRLGPDPTEGTHYDGIVSDDGGEEGEARIDRLPCTDTKLRQKDGTMTYHRRQYGVDAGTEALNAVRAIGRGCDPAQWPGADDTDGSCEKGAMLLIEDDPLHPPGPLREQQGGIQKNPHGKPCERPFHSTVSGLDN
jgi:hypothetical protein